MFSTLGITRLDWRGDPPDYKLVDARYLSLHSWMTERQTDPAREAEMFAAGCARLRLLETVVLAEEHFGVQVDTGGLDALATVGDIVRLMRYSGGQGEFP